MAENAHKSEKAIPCCSAVEHSILISSLSEERRNLISVANKVFGEGKWSHTVVKQTRDFVSYVGNKSRVRCDSYIKIQLENGNCYEGDGFYIIEKSVEKTDDDDCLRSQTLKIGSAVNALKKVLLSFGDEVERELKQLRRQIDSERVNTFTAEPLNLAINFRDLISVANKVFGEDKWNYTVDRQLLDFVHKSVGCLSFVRVQLENGNFHEDIGYYYAKELTEGLSIQNARIGSAVNALKIALLSFGDKVERELQQLQRQISSEQVNTFAAAEPMDLAINFHDLISVANKVFGEGKWSHAVVYQDLDFRDPYKTHYAARSDKVDFDEKDPNEIYISDKCIGCVSHVMVQLENGNFHRDIGYIAKELTEDLSLQNTRIGSAVNALKRVLLSFGDKIERELQQLQRQMSSEQVDTFAAAEPMDLAINFHDLISVANKVFGEGKWSHDVVYQNLDFCNNFYYTDYDSADSFEDYNDVDSLVDYDNVIYHEINDGKINKYGGCVSYVNIQLENGNFHADIGYMNAGEGLTEGLLRQTVRYGSAVNALFRVLLSFGDKVERELKQLQRQIDSERVNMFTAAESMDLTINFHNLISVANKVFGEGKWNHTVVRHTLDYIDLDRDLRYSGNVNERKKYCAGCVSYVRIQLQNGNYHEDIGYINADEFSESLPIKIVRIGSAINALFRALLSFGNKDVERELKLRRQIGSEQVKTFDAAEPIDVAINFHDLISVANKVFGEGKWNHTVVCQTLDFIETYKNYAAIDAQDKYRIGCVSFVKVQLENGNFHGDVGYFNAEESTIHLSIYNARIGSTVNALNRVLLSFGDKVERELQELRRQISSDQEPMDLAADFSDLISVANKAFGEGKWNHTVVRQTLDLDDKYYHGLVVCRDRFGCVSFVKVQLENGNFHEDVGYFIEERSAEGLSIYNVRIGSAVNGLKRVLLSFGDKVERELQRQIISKQVRDIKRNVTQSLEPMDLIAEFPDLISAANKVFGEGNWRHTVVKQKLVREFAIDDEKHAECFCYIKVQLKNKNFHVDIGYCIAKEPTYGLAELNAKIGSAVIALKRVLLSFGEKIERELKGQIRLEQTNDVQDVTHSLDKQNS